MHMYVVSLDASINADPCHVARDDGMLRSGLYCCHDVFIKSAIISLS